MNLGLENIYVLVKSGKKLLVINGFIVRQKIDCLLMTCNTWRHLLRLTTFDLTTFRTFYTQMHRIFSTFFADFGPALITSSLQISQKCRL